MYGLIGKKLKGREKERNHLKVKLECHTVICRYDRRNEEEDEIIIWY